jgi:hypothetical protein
MKKKAAKRCLVYNKKRVYIAIGHTRKQPIRTGCFLDAA